MANRYWVGGTGTWTDTARWSTTSGGAGGASVPGASDAAIFDANSGGGTVSLNLSVTLQSLITTNFTGSFSAIGGAWLLATTVAMTLGSQSFNTGVLLRCTGGTVSMTASTAAFSQFTISSTSSAVTVQSALRGVSSISIARQTFDINTNNNAINVLNSGSFYASASGGSFNLGSSSITAGYASFSAGGGNITHTGSLSINPAVFDLYQSGSNTVSISSLPSTMQTLTYTRIGTGTISIPANLTVTSSLQVKGTCPSNITFSGTNAVFQTAGLTNTEVTSLSITTNGAVSLSGSGYPTSITPTFTATNANTTELNLTSNVAVGTLNIDGPAAKVTVKSSSSGVRRILSASSFSLADIAWKDIEAAGTIPFTGLNFEDLGNNLNITFPAGGSGLFFGSNF